MYRLCLKLEGRLDGKKGWKGGLFSFREMFRLLTRSGPNLSCVHEKLCVDMSQTSQNCVGMVTAVLHKQEIVQNNVTGGITTALFEKVTRKKPS
ncbi:hypothetical protein RHMOL_Rhmol07G0267300 [Rhododendron molle]|uniref:Uncharacterized protein n=1 Tax=Rhododendron molle TaxID=49168 RepID=A0ACC0N700_RHOML|nr:hypothetical protein RHMOL_Rhmol07G0267300 [Rhododendron molle]